MIQKNISTLIKHDDEHLYKGGSFVVSNNKFANSKIEISNKHYVFNQHPQIKTGFRKLNSKIYVDSVSFTNNIVKLRVFYPFNTFTAFAHSFSHTIDPLHESVISYFENNSQTHITSRFSFHLIELPIENPNQYTYVYIKSDNHIDDQLILIS